MHSGELIVMGTNQAQFELGLVPIKIDVYYSDGGEIITPCNIHYLDKLDWTINGSILTINWQVSGIREIKYHAWFYWSEIQT